jgi:hypothetical protein
MITHDEVRGPPGRRIIRLQDGAIVEDDETQRRSSCARRARPPLLLRAEDAVAS